MRVCPGPCLSQPSPWSRAYRVLWTPLLLEPVPTTHGFPEQGSPPSPSPCFPTSRSVISSVLHPLGTRADKRTPPSSCSDCQVLCRLLAFFRLTTDRILNWTLYHCHPRSLSSPLEDSASDSCLVVTFWCRVHSYILPSQHRHTFLSCAQKLIFWVPL